MEKLSRSRKNGNQRLRKLERNRADICLIKMIKDRRKRNGKYEYLVQWQGSTKEEDSWHHDMDLPSESPAFL